MQALRVWLGSALQHPYNKKPWVVAREMTKWLRALAALKEDLGSIPSAHVRKLTTTYTSSYGDGETSIGTGGGGTVGLPAFHNAEKSRISERPCLSA